MRRLLRLVFALVVAFALTGGTVSAHHRPDHASAAGGVAGPAFYVDGQIYRTVATPTDLSGTGAPDHSFDVIYAIEGQLNVAQAAPGDTDYNGGRWMVIAVSFLPSYQAALAGYDTNNSGTFDSTEEIQGAVNGGAATLKDTGVRFECPVVPEPAGNGG